MLAHFKVHIWPTGLRAGKTGLDESNSSSTNVHRQVRANVVRQLGWIVRGVAAAARPARRCPIGPPAIT